MATTYATTTDYVNYVEGWTTDDVGALGRLIERAEEDIDDFISGSYGTSGRKLVLVNLSATQIKYLSRATCAQAEYRWQMGEDFFAQSQFDSVSGPDFNTTGKRPRLGPKARRELIRGRLMASVGRARA